MPFTKPLLDLVVQ
jgi:hypothetical protein